MFSRAVLRWKLQANRNYKPKKAGATKKYCSQNGAPKKAGATKKTKKNEPGKWRKIVPKMAIPEAGNFFGGGVLWRSFSYGEEGRHQKILQTRKKRAPPKKRKKRARKNAKNDPKTGETKFGGAVVVGVLW